ncbi:hypothetical protein HUT19_34405 [Streptomyces sp. NA02950]|uniref:hypothetical protein n=1 Tax=Streptomyces sp. NA02950 TaxID=2742137 RepID=UPI001590C896|nr:hypothetical protein [Streptomyces sp. NA02950]QKV96189.1 hypothetical protein HUT19_34405 [Streptomyces sp. NA02950]
MYSYVLGFNLALRGDEASRFLEEAVRTWPSLWDSIPGVRGFLLLRGALALGGPFEYQLRVDIDTLNTLSTIDRVMASGEGGWRKTRSKWFKARTVAHARVLGFVDGDEGHLNGQGAIHLLAPCRPDGSGQPESCLQAVREVPGVVSAQVLRPALAAADAQEELWVRLQSLDNLDAVAAAGGLATGRAQLFGELREVDGALFAGA